MLKSIARLVKFDNKSIDVTTKLAGEIFCLTATKGEIEIYWDLAANIRDHFLNLGLVSVNAYLYSPFGCGIFMVHVYGRSPETGQRFHVLF